MFLSYASNILFTAIYSSNLPSFYHLFIVFQIMFSILLTCSSPFTLITFNKNKLLT
nr:MAG TPA_asm: hypothetical protein [Caudoviricetes sp.]